MDSMDSEQQFKATLVASLDSRGSISGSITREGVDPIPFTGWLGLAGAINDLAERNGGEATPRTRRNLLGDDRGGGEVN